MYSGITHAQLRFNELQIKRSEVNICYFCRFRLQIDETKKFVDQILFPKRGAAVLASTREQLRNWCFVVVHWKINEPLSVFPLRSCFLRLRVTTALWRLWMKTLCFVITIGVFAKQFWCGLLGDRLQCFTFTGFSSAFIGTSCTSTNGLLSSHLIVYFRLCYSSVSILRTLSP